MRLAGQDQSRDPFFQFTVTLVTSLLGILTVATNKDGLVWKYTGLNIFSANFNGLEVRWDQPNNEPAFLYMGNGVIQDNGSGAYGFEELANAIWEQKKRLDDEYDGFYQER